MAVAMLVVVVSRLPLLVLSIKNYQMGRTFAHMGILQIRGVFRK